MTEADEQRQNSAYDLEDSFDQEQGLSLTFIRSIIYRNRYIVLFTLLLSLMLGLTVTLLTNPIFSATASIQIDQQTSNILQTEDVQPTVAFADTGRFLETQVNLLESRTMAAKVADDLHLLADDSFIISMGGKPLAAGPKSAEARRERVTALLIQNLTVDLPRTSRVASISFKSREPVLASRVANAYVTTYIKSNLERKFDASSYARAFLEQQISTVKARLEVSERAIIEYSRNARLVDLPATAEGPAKSLTTSNLSDLNSAYALAKAKRIQLEQRWRSAENTPTMALAEVLANTSIQTLMQGAAQQTAELMQLKARYKPDHPLVQQANVRLNELNAQVNRQADNIRRSIHDDYLVAKSQEASFGSDVNILTADSLGEQDRRVRYNILKREVDTNRTLYDALLQRYKEITAASGITSNNVSIVDSAVTPKNSVLPKPFLNLMIAGIVGLVAAAAIVFLRENFDDTIRTPDDVPRKLGLTLLGSIPVATEEGSVEQQLGDPRSSVSEAYYSLRTAIQFATPRGKPPILFFTSSQPGEGKSTSAIAIARGSANAKHRVLLIDGDLRRPSLHRWMGLSNPMGLADLLAGQRSLAEVVQATEFTGLSIVTSGQIPPNPANLLGSSALEYVLEKAREEFDLIVLDGPPMMGLADGQLLAREASGTVFVIEANNAHRGQAKAAIRRLMAARTNILGCVVTKYDARKSGQGYEYSYYDYGSSKEA
jgi:capsular exopolysaccharide synthesis family protein